MTLPDYQIVRLPVVSASDASDLREDALLTKSRAFRLSALQESPDSFGSIYEHEVILPIERTRHRHSHFLSINYVAAPQDMSADNIASGDVEWAGSLGGYGPEVETAARRAAFHFEPLKNITGRETPLDVILANKTAVGKSLHYHWNALYVSPSVRGQGVGAALLREAMTDAENTGLACEAQEVRHTIAVSAGIDSALKLYEKVGFRIIEEGTYKHGLKQEERGWFILERLVPLVGKDDHGRTDTS